jgi:hypothetical protein
MQPHDLNIKVVELSNLYMDDLGHFPIQFHHVGSNSIPVEPFKSRANTHRIPAYNRIMERLQARGITVNLQIFDNKASAVYIANITVKWKCKHQKVPPDMHRRNIAERMIRTFKAHLISIIFGDKLLVQAELTVNLLRTSKRDPTKLAWEFLNGPFNYDATPMGLPGSRIIAHAKGSTRRSWDCRGIEGFYIGPVMNHY